MPGLNRTTSAPRGLNSGGVFRPSALVAMTAGLFVLLLIAVAVIAPWVAPFDAENYFDYDRLNDGTVDAAPGSA